MQRSAAYWIEKLGLISHPEGGYYLETYRSGLELQQLPASFIGTRQAGTCIYYLLEADQFSAFHRIASDEIWHFYAGEELQIFEIQLNGSLKIHRLGPDPEKGESFQVMILSGHWFGARLTARQGFALVGCTVSPGFDFKDFEMAKRDDLIELYPQQMKIIRELTR
jgi:predicted cupin superfamily sugar epimerase